MYMQEGTGYPAYIFPANHIISPEKVEEKIVLNEYERLEDMGFRGLKIVQDTRLYRFTSDSVLLSRFAKAKKNDVVADFCAGSGIVAFHFYALNKDMLPSLRFTLFEMQAELSALSKKTAAYNGFDNFEFVQGKLQEIPKEFLALCGGQW